MSRARSLPPKSSKAGRSRGVVSIETLVCFPIVLVTFLGIVQLSLLYATRLVVQHAANRALRAAVVVLDDEPERYAGEARNRLGPRRLQAIRSAAYGPLGAVAPPALDVAEQAWGKSTTVKDAASFSLLASVAARVASLPGISAITVHAGADPEKPVETVGAHDDVTIVVRFLAPCLVPLVARIICQSGSAFLLGEQQGELDQVESSTLRDLWLMAPGVRFSLLRAKATGTLQGANYHKDEGGES